MTTAPLFLDKSISDKGLRWTEVASKSGMNFRTLRMILDGKVHVTPDILTRLSSAVDELVAEREVG